MNRNTDVFCCEPGWEPFLAAELEAVFPGSRIAVLAPGWIMSRRDQRTTSDAPAACVALANQCLPNAVAVEAPSINAWAQLVAPKIVEALADFTGPWRLDVFANDYASSDVSPKRCELIVAAIREWLKKKQRRLLRTWRHSVGPELTTGETIAFPILIQVGLMTAGAGFLSICPPDELNSLDRCVAPFPGGVVDIAPDPQAPSRAFAKLLEAEMRLGRKIAAGQSCVDLGSSPGSWAYIALQRGASVAAVDRSPLRDDLMRHPELTFVRGDAFRFEPLQSVDWLLCDVIAAPERSIELLRHWLDQRWCRQFCLTIKFRGQEEYHRLEPLKHWLATNAADFQLRRLTNNKNEVTALGIAKNLEPRTK